MHCHKRSLEGERNSSCLEIGDAISLLANQERRDLLMHLKNAQDPVSLETVVKHLATPGDKTGDGGIGEETRKTVRISLLHNHIPRLEEAGIAVCDEEAETVEYRSDHVLEEFLEVCQRLNS